MGREVSVHLAHVAPEGDIGRYPSLANAQIVCFLLAHGHPPMTEGICKLTGQKGKFVKSHIIPAALTTTPDGTSPLIHAGRGRRPIKRWDSSYDRQLVTHAGESILEQYDDWAIKELRRHKLVWSSWGPMQKLSTGDFKALDSGWGYRAISDIDQKRLRIFFLSPLWRAAATELVEFSDVKLDDCDLDRLRTMVQTGTAEPIEFYPVTLIQLSTRGFEHNYTATVEVKTNPGFGEVPDRTIPHIRFYFDGLVAHIHRERSGQLDESIVGAHPKLTVCTVTFEESRHLRYLIACMRGKQDSPILNPRSFRSGR